MSLLENLNKFGLKKPWAPANQLNVTNKDARFVQRWCSIDNLEHKIAEGWEVVSRTSDPNIKIAADGALLKPDNTYRKGRLILCRMPKEIAKERNDYYRKQSGADMLKDEVEKLNKQLDGNVVGTYGEVKTD